MTMLQDQTDGWWWFRDPVCISQKGHGICNFVNDLIASSVVFIACDMYTPNFFPSCSLTIHFRGMPLMLNVMSFPMSMRLVEP